MPLVTLKDTQVMECSHFFFLLSLFFRHYPAQENLSVIDGGSLQTA